MPTLANFTLPRPRGCAIDWETRQTRVSPIRQKSLLIDGPSFAPATLLGSIEDKLRRVGVIDIGSNSVRMVVFDGAARSPAYFYNEKVLCGLGRGMSETGRLHPEGRASALSSIQRFVALAEHMQLGVLSAVATAAVREAEDGPDFVAEIERKTRLPVMVASGRQEATLSAQGVLLGWPDAEGLVCDIGGSSMELARIVRGKIVAAETSPLGPLSLHGLPEAERPARIAAHLARLRDVFTEETGRLYLVGGSWRAIGRLDMIRRNYPLHVLHEYRLKAGLLAETAEWVQSQTPDHLSSMTDTSLARLTLVPTAGQVLCGVLDTFKPDDVAISAYGLREGLLYAHMTKPIRKRDPLLEAARHMEEASARFPGFGDALYRWLKPLYAHQDRSLRRLNKAACLMHDITWRAHPDYRPEVCFESVTRANLGGLNHPERVFLGLALLNRYKPSHKVATAEPLLPLLDADRIQAAEALGRAMRLGAMLSGGSKRLLAKTALSVGDGKVTLYLRPSVSMHSGEVVEKRLSGLATALGMAYGIEVVSKLPRKT